VPTAEITVDVPVVGVRVALEVVPLLHVPVDVSVTVDVAPEQALIPVPPNTGGNGFTVSVVLMKQVPPKE